MRTLVVVVALSWPLLAATSCENLAPLALPHATVTLAQAVGAGQLTLPTALNFGNLPAICRVAATLKPPTDAGIRIEVWMPAESSNGKLESVGKGAWAGNISYRDL